MKKFELIKSEYNERIDFYENDFYKIRVTKFESGAISCNVNEKVEGLPTIYIREDSNDEIESVEIQTTSYGGLDIAGIEKMIEGYRIAIETVKEINKMFNLEQE